MRSLLVLLLILALGSAGFEYYVHEQQTALYLQHRTSLTADISRLKKQNQELEQETASLTGKLTGLQNQDADLRAQLANAQNTTNAPGAPAPAPAP